MKKQNLKSQTGQGLVEYLIIVALVAVGAISIMQIVGQSVNVKFAQVAKSLGANSGDSIQNAEITKTSVHKKNFRNFMSGTINEGSNSNGKSGENSSGE
jgi:Flp pilus assembly pilin Flp